MTESYIYNEKTHLTKTNISSSTIKTTYEQKAQENLSVYSSLDVR